MAGIGAAEVEVAPAVRQQAQAVGEGRGAQGQPDAGGALAEGGGGRGDRGAHPERGGGDAEGPGAAGDRGAELFLRGPEFPQQAARALDGGGPERRRADARRDALEQPAAEARLEPGDGAGERRLGDGETLGGGADASGLGDRDQPDEFAAGLEHAALPASPRPAGSPPALPNLIWACAGPGAHRVFQWRGRAGRMFPGTACRPAVPERPVPPGPHSGPGALRRRPARYRPGMDFVPNGIFISSDVPLMASAPGAAP